MTERDYTNFSLSRDGRGVVRVMIDVPGRAMNVFNEPVVEELASIIMALEHDEAARVVVFSSGKESGFCAGADVERIRGVTRPEEAEAASAQVQELFNRLERLPQLTLAVIHGVCLGGGLEFALACRHRVARDDASTRIGLPEIQLGILPAWGGTQRLPRQVGLVRGLQLILQGRHVTARDAARYGLIDRTLPPDDLAAGVDRFIDELLAGKSDALRSRPKRSFVQRLQDDTPIGRWLVFRTARRRIASQVEHYPAVGEALEAIERGFRQSREAGFQYERTALGRLLFTPTCRNLLSIFFLRERARSGAGPWAESAARGAEQPDVRPVDRLGVIGAGAMGAGIAQLAAYNGIDVVMKDIEQRFLDAGMKQIESLFERAVRRGPLRREEAERRMARIRTTLDWEPLADVDLALEAVVEREDVKRQVFGELQRRLRGEALLASNTSSLPITRLSEAIQSPERMAGLHFFNPPHRMPLVEVVRTDRTGGPTLASLVDFARRLGKTPVVVRDSPGFLVNRVLSPYLGEAVRLACEGVPVAKIDAQMRRFGMPMGPLELLDQIGLDVAADVSAMLAPLSPDPGPAPERLAAMVVEGHLGRKTGRGFYDYRGGKKGEAAPLVGEAHGAPGTNDDLLEDRLVCLLINEAARCLEEKVVDEAGMVDLAMVMGTGFAPFRGGPLRLADQRGLAEVKAILDGLQERLGDRFTPCDLLSRLAAEGKTFYPDGGA